MEELLQIGLGLFGGLACSAGMNLMSTAICRRRLASACAPFWPP